MREAEQRLTEEQETMLGLQVPTNPPFCPKFVTLFLGSVILVVIGLANEKSGWLSVQVLSPHCNRPMCRYRPLQAEAEAMMPVEEISDDSSMVDIARIDIKVVRAAEGMEARFGYLFYSKSC